jgi:MSHA biogenesis protein MshJ
MSLKYQLREFADKFDSRSAPEKILLAVLLIVGLIWSYSSFFLSPVQTESDNLRLQLSQTQLQLDALLAREQLAVTSSAEDPNMAVRLRIERAIADQNALQGDIEALAGNLVTPQSMTRMLTSILESQTGLQLVRVENRAPQAMRAEGEPVADNPDVVVADTSTAGGQQVYKHSLMLELEGDYLSLIAYLRRIESFPERFFWDQLTFVQTTWPTARITIEMHTLSTEEGFVGV